MNGKFHASQASPIPPLSHFSAAAHVNCRANVLPRSETEANGALAASLEFSFTGALRLGQFHPQDNDPAEVLDTYTPLAPAPQPAENSIVNYRPEPSMSSRRKIGPAKEPDDSTTRRELFSKHGATVDTSINSSAFVIRPTTSDTVSKAKPATSRMPGAVKVAQKPPGPIPRGIMVLMVLNVIVTSLAVGLNVYQHFRVHDLYSKANSVRGAAANATIGLVEFTRNIDTSLKSTRGNVASQFSAQNATCAEKLRAIIAACTEIKAWAATVKTTTAAIYNKLWDHDKVVAAVNDDSDEIIEKFAPLKTSIDNGFPAASATDPIVQSIYSTLGQDQTTVSTVNTNLNSMCTSMSNGITETVTNSHEIKENLASAQFFSSPASVACTAKKKSILIVSLTGSVHMPSIIDTNVIVATVDNVDFYTDWIYSLPYYDVLIFDFAEDFSNLCSGFSSTIQNGVVAFLKRGGSMMATHDTIDSKFIWISELYPYFGLVSQPCTILFAYGATAYKNTANACHQIFQKPNDFSTMTSISVSLVHSSYACLTTGTLLMTTNGDRNLYLIVKETTVGSVVTRCVYAPAGHTYDFTPDEKKLFNNEIYWLLKAP